MLFVGANERTVARSAATRFARPASKRDRGAVATLGRAIRVPSSPRGRDEVIAPLPLGIAKATSGFSRLCLARSEVRGPSWRRT